MRAYYLLILSLFLLSLPLSQTALATTSDGKFVVVIDPGHGGTDTGTPRRKKSQDEKVIALKVATRLGNSIKAHHKDVKVVYTRSTDKTLSLANRTQIGKSNKGDLFISIHVNGCKDPSAYGIETYVFGVSGEKDKQESEQRRIHERMEDERENIDITGRQVNFDTDIDLETKILCQAQREKHNKYSREFANLVQKNIVSQLRTTSYAKHIDDRGVKAKNLFVLCYSPMPSILVELGYMSNVKEEAFMNTEEALNAYTTALYNSFSTYKGNWDKRQLNGAAETTTPAANPDPIPAAKPEKPQTKTQPAPQPATPKAEQPKEQPKTEPTPAQPAQPSAAETKDVVYYTIQFLISPNKLPDGSKEFKGLSPVSYYRSGKYYKYTYGKARQSTQLNAEMKQVKALFPDAFFIRVDADGNRINP